MAISETMMATDSIHLLANRWTMWAHLPHDTDWSIFCHQCYWNYHIAQEKFLYYQDMDVELLQSESRYCYKRRKKYHVTRMYLQETYT